MNIGLAMRLALKNLLGAGLRTWLNVGVLSFAFVIIIFHNGLIDGWNRQARQDTIAWETGFGHLVHQDYDPYDPFTLQDSHAALDPAGDRSLAPVLIRQATLYPDGRMMPVLVTGIDPDQNILKLPTRFFRGADAGIPAIIGRRTATAAHVSTGDQVLLRWRDRNGTFDAADITIVHIFDTNVPTTDNGRVWIPIHTLWEMTGLTGHATLFVAGDETPLPAFPGWTFRDRDTLLKPLDDMIAMKKAGGSVMYLLLLAIALLAIFDTQVLSVFRRQREIGTYIALGMTRPQVVALFSVEGTLNSFLACLLGCLYGVPVFLFLGRTGIGMPATADDMGIAIAERIFPVYGIGLILGTVGLVVISAAIVSFLPARRIARMDPVDALKGKIQ